LPGSGELPSTQERATVPRRDDDLVRLAREDLRTLRKAPWFQEGRWSISPTNFLAETKAPLAVPPRVQLNDITGRVIEQMPGIALTVQEKVHLARALSDAGVPEMQPVQNIHLRRMREHVEGIRDAGLPIRLAVLCSTEDDLQVASASGAHVAEITIQGRPSLYSTYTGRRATSNDELLKRGRHLIAVAKGLRLSARADINDVGYSDIEYVRDFAKMAAEAGADSIYLADSSASLGPRAMGYLVGLVRSVAPGVPIGLHLHNDFNLAATVAISALEAGAEIFDVSVNGVGEKAGQLDLAPFAVSVEAFYQVQTGIRLDRMYELSKLVQDLSRIPIPPVFPVVGDRAFASAVMNVQMGEVYVDPYYLHSINPECVGNRRDLPLGRHTREFGLLRKADELGYALTIDQVPPALEDLDDWFELHKRPITDSEVIRILKGRRAELVRAASAAPARQ